LAALLAMFADPLVDPLLAPWPDAPRRDASQAGKRSVYATAAETRGRSPSRRGAPALFIIPEPGRGLDFMDTPCGLLERRHGIS